MPSRGIEGGVEIGGHGFDFPRIEQRGCKLFRYNQTTTTNPRAESLSQFHRKALAQHSSCGRRSLVILAYTRDLTKLANQI